ncbi:MAG: glycosyltransferase [Chloroflexota bacterium]
MSPKMRILEVVASFSVEGPGGGAARFGLALSRALTLQDKEIEPVVCGLWDQGSTAERERTEGLLSNGVEAFVATAWDGHHPYKSFWQAFLVLWEYLKRSGVDVIHSHSEFGDVIACLLKAAGEVNLIVRTVHNHEWRRRPLRRLMLTNVLYPLWFDCELAVSSHLAEVLNRRPLGRLLRRQAEYLPNALDIERLEGLRGNRDEMMPRLGLPSDALLVGSVGRLAEQKGYSYLLEAAAIVLARLPSTFFILIGAGDLDNELRQQAQALGIASRVRFLGAQQEALEILSCFHLFVSSSLWEGMPSVVLESMALGVPVLATDIAGTQDLIHHQENGWLVPPQNAEALAQGMLTLLNNPELARALAHRALSTPKSFFIKRITEQQAVLYHRLMGRVNKA